MASYTDARALRTNLTNVFRLRAFVPREHLDGVRVELADMPGVRHVMPVAGPDDGTTLLTAEVHPASAEHVLALLDGAGVPRDAFNLSHEDVISVGGLQPTGGREMAWAEVLGNARASARPLGTYLCLMAVAGVIAAFGVIERNEILIVGAMAVSPDLLPLCAACVGIQAGRPRLATRAVGTLAVGLAIAGVVAFLLTLVLDAIGWLAEGFRVGEGGIGSLGEVDVSTVGVAAAAGVAAVLAFETRASAVVGVAISVTTIPAATFMGVSAGSGHSSDALGALAVLGVNVAALLATGTATLAVQRGRHRGAAGPATWG